MKLEERVAQWVELGLMPYQKCYALQLELVKLRQRGALGDIILSVQHPHEVNFGNDKNNNQFSDELIAEIVKTKGKDYNENDLLYHLKSLGVNFSKSDRGGGATVVSPGQLVYYPIVDHTQITGNSMNLVGYKEKIYRILFETLKGLGVEGIEVGSQQAYDTRRERKDAWIQRDGKSLKMASKALKTSGDVAYHGFVFYIDKEGVDPFWLVKPCGYGRDEAIVRSVEEELGKEINHENVHSIVRENVARHFEYDRIERLNHRKLYEMMSGLRSVCPA